MREHWPQIKALFAEAIELQPEARRAFVEGATFTEPEVCAKVLDMLDSFELDETKFLRRPGSTMGPGATPFPPEAPDIKRLGSVRIDGVIGRGAMGYVLSGHDERLDRQVAVKCLPTTSSMTAEQTQRFEIEARSIAQLNHPSIVTVYGVESSGDDSFIVMAHLAGPDLREELETLRAEVPGAHLPAFGAPGYTGAVVDLVRQVAEALAHAHEQGVIHRDVKPANLLFDETGRPVLVDFGLARIVGTASLTMDSDVRGTAHYMSPEQARLLSDNTVDGRTDVYALGCVLYELLTLEKPYPGDGFQEVFAAKAAGSPPAPRQVNPAIPRDLDTICGIAISREPKDRYATAAAFAEDLLRFLDHRSILASPPGVHVRAVRWLRRHAALLALGAVLVAASVLLTVWGAGQVRRFAWPSVDLVVVDRAGAPISAPTARVSWSPLNKSNGAPGPARLLGRQAAGPFKIEPGAGRIRVEFEGGSLAETFVVVGGDDAQQSVQVTTIGSSAFDDSGMVLVRGGRFNELPWFDPQRSPNFVGVEVPDFLLDKREVTHGEFFIFAQEFPQYFSAWWFEQGMVDPTTIRLLPDAELAPELADLPVTSFTAEAAMAYAAWRGCRLPTLFELNLAAARIPGVDPSREYPTLSEQGMRDPTYDGAILPVSAPVELSSVEGVENLLGNAREWTETPVLSGGVLDLSRLWVGASAGTFPKASAAWPLRTFPGGRGNDTVATAGFRCARTR